MEQGGPLLAVLILRRGATGPGGHVAIRQSTVRLGRDESNAVVFPAPSVSAAHAELRLRGGVWSLIDLGSMHGSWVDGEPVYGAIPLGPGSTVRMGEVEWVFSPKDRWEDSPNELMLDAAPLQADLGPPLPDEAPTSGMVPAPARRFRDDPPLFALPDQPRRPGALIFFVVAIAVAALVYYFRQVI